MRYLLIILFCSMFFLDVVFAADTFTILDNYLNKVINTYNSAGPSAARPLYLRENSNRTQVVRGLQQILNANGARLKVDGDFGPETKQAIINFQKNNFLKADGVIGAETVQALRDTTPIQVVEKVNAQINPQVAGSLQYASNDISLPKTGASIEQGEIISQKSVPATDITNPKPSVPIENNPSPTPESSYFNEMVEGIKYYAQKAVDGVASIFNGKENDLDPGKEISQGADRLANEVEKNTYNTLKNMYPNASEKDLREAANEAGDTAFSDYQSRVSGGENPSEVVKDNLAIFNQTPRDSAIANGATPSEVAKYFDEKGEYVDSKRISGDESDVDGTKSQIPDYGGQVFRDSLDTNLKNLTTSNDEVKIEVGQPDLDKLEDAHSRIKYEYEQALKAPDDAKFPAKEGGTIGKEEYLERGLKEMEKIQNAIDNITGKDLAAKNNENIKQVESGKVDKADTFYKCTKKNEEIICEKKKDKKIVISESLDDKNKGSENRILQVSDQGLPSNGATYVKDDKDFKEPAKDVVYTDKIVPKVKGGKVIWVPKNSKDVIKPTQEATKKIDYAEPKAQTAATQPALPTVTK